MSGQMFPALLRYWRNRRGWSQLFSVDDVGAAREAALSRGGSPVGEVVTLPTATGAKVTWCYLRDPESNIVELQSWA